MKEKIKGIVDNNLSVLVIYACLVAAIFALIIISQCVNMPMCQLAALYATWPLTN